MDLYRTNKHDTLLKKLIRNNTLLPVEQIYTQQIAYTYQLDKKSSFIDHILANQRIQKNIYHCNILTDESNTSDHHAIQISLKFSCDVNIAKQPKPKKKIDWSNVLQSAKFREVAISKLNNMDIDQMKKDTEKTNKTIETAIKDINQIFSEATNEVLTEQMTQNKKGNKKLKRKSWWDDEIDKIYKEKVYWYLMYKEANFDDEYLRKTYNIKRKNFRYIQRIKSRLHRRKELEHLNKLFNLSDKSDFWKLVKSMRAM